MVNKTDKMNDEEYEIHAIAHTKREEVISRRMLLFSTMKSAKCPYCNSDIKNKDEIREDILKLMREDNKLTGQEYHIAIVDGNKEWKV